MNSSNSNICSNCSSNCFLNKIKNQDIINQIEVNNKSHFYSKNKNIFNEGMLVSDIHFIQSGIVKVFKTGLHFKNKIIRFSNDGDILGHRGLNEKYYPISAVTLTDCVICSLPMSYFKELINKDIDLSQQLLFFYANELTDSETRERNMAQMSVREKIADTLLYLESKFGCDSNNILKIQLSRQDLADYAGTTKEQVSKVLSEFKDEKLIDFKTKSIKIRNIDKLQNLISI